MTSRRALLAAFALIVVGLVWFLWPRPEADHPASGVSGTPSASPASAVSPRPSATAAPAPTEVSHLADLLNAPTGDIRADLRILLDVVEAFRTNFPKDGNPVGSNAEITAALTGRNKIRLALIPPHNPAINKAGELCDRWGTPFFFHAESASKMEIRSAGPDRKMWNDDDVVVTP